MAGRVLINRFDRSSCRCNRCGRPLRHDADCSAEVTGPNAAHNDKWDIRGNPRCGGCTHDYKGPHSVWMDTDLKSDEMPSIHQAMMEDWDPSRREWEAVIHQIRRAATVEHNPNGDDETLPWRKRRVYAAKLLIEAIQYFHEGIRPDGSFRRIYRDPRKVTLARHRKAYEAGRRKAA